MPRAGQSPGASAETNSFSGVGIAGETLYAGYEFHESTDGVGLSAFGLGGGDQQWHTADVGSVTRVLPAGEDVLVATEGALQGVDTDGQSSCWRYRPSGGDATVTDVAFRDGRIYATLTTRSSDVPDGGVVVAIDPSDGVAWSSELDSPATGLTVGPERVFVRSDAIVALAVADGAVDWRVETRGGPAHGMAFDGGRLVFGGYFSVVAVDAADGSKRWRWDAEATDFSPVVAGDAIVALGSDRSAGTGRLVLLDTGGERRAETTVRGGQAVRGPAVTNGRVSVGTADGRVVATEPR
jgi:outer membrane protein assembly factor BamB